MLRLTIGFVSKAAAAQAFVMISMGQHAAAYVCKKAFGGDYADAMHNRCRRLCCTLS